MSIAMAATTAAETVTAPPSGEPDDGIPIVVDEPDQQLPAGKYFTREQVNEIISKRVAKLARQFRRREQNLIRSMTQKLEAEKAELVATVAKRTAALLAAKKEK